MDVIYFISGVETPCPRNGLLNNYRGFKEGFTDPWPGRKYGADSLRPTALLCMPEIQ